MTDTILPLHPETHGNVRLKDPRTLDMSGAQILPLVIHEFPAAANDMPVVFVKNAETGQFQAIGLIGLVQGENLLVDKDGWGNHYVPRIVMNMPLKLLTVENETNRLLVGVDSSSPLVSETEGTALYADGAESDYLNMRKHAISAYLDQDTITRGVIGLFVELDLLVARSLNVEVSGKQIQMDGIYMIDEDKFNELPDDKFLDLRKRGLLPVIYAHLVSLQKVRYLGGLKARRNAS